MKKITIPFLSLFLFGSLPVFADDFTVDINADFVDSTPGDGACSGTLNFCSLRAAVMEANAHPGEDTVTVPSGVYTLTIPSGGAPDDGTDGDLDVLEDLIINGAGSSMTIVDGNGGVTLDRIFHILPPATAFTMTGLQLRNGDAGGGDGGGMLIETNIAGTLTDVDVHHNTANNVGGIGTRGPLTITDSFVEDNTAGSAVGGVGAQGHPLTLVNTIVERNTAGGGPFSAGGVGTNHDVTITGGSVSHNQAAGSGGGVLMLAPGKTMTLTDVTIEGNEADNGGGIISTGVTVLENCRVIGNAALTAEGGGVLAGPDPVTITGGRIAENSAASLGGGIRASGPLTIDGTVIETNSSLTVGGGILSSGLFLNTLTGITIADNTSQIGAGLVVVGDLTMEDGTVSGNTALSGPGGGVFHNGSGGETVEIRRSTISDNIAADGGGLIMTAPGTLTVSDTTVSGNRALGGEAGGLGFSTGITATITNATVSGNTAASDGGGIFNGGTLTLVNATLFGNEATTGGNLFTPGGATSELKNTILAGAVSGGNCSGSTTSLGFNIEDTNVCGLTATGDLFDTDPKLGPLEDNGGPTLTHALLSDSPAIDAGTDAGAPATDQRGVTRPLDGNVDGTAAHDIGAVELDRCGDGAVQEGEDCDDGNTDDTDACLNTCVTASCGDGLVRSGTESCDDGNIAAGDGCSDTCQTEDGGATGDSGGCSLIRP